MLLSYDEARRAARRRLPRALFDYIDRGVGREASLLALRQSLDAAQIAPRVLRAASDRQISLRLFGADCGAPMVIAPTAMAGLLRHDGEILLARAAARHGLPVALSTQSVTSVERLAASVPEAQLWMQLYLWRDMAASRGLMERAWSAGARVLVMTVDTPRGARKPWNSRSGFDMPFRVTPRGLGDLALRPGWLARVILPALARGALPRLENYPQGARPGLLGPAVAPGLRLRRDLGWEDVARVRAAWPGMLVLKGILGPEDAEQAAALGADGLVVSSHGARNFDAAPPPIAVLPQIVSAVGGRLCVMADSGVRDGLDVLRYRAAGARAVMIGRLPLWALAAGGEAAAAQMLGLLVQDYRDALDFSGQAA